MTDGPFLCKLVNLEHQCGIKHFSTVADRIRFSLASLASSGNLILSLCHHSNFSKVSRIPPLTTPRWRRQAPPPLAASSSYSSAACFLCSSPEPRCERHTARHWTRTAGTSWCGSAGLRSAGSGTPPGTGGSKTAAVKPSHPYTHTDLHF